MEDLYKAIDPLTLPPPDVVETPEFENIFNAHLEHFKSLAPDYAVFTEADPVVKLLQAVAYRELLLRSRINHVAKSRLLSFATGADLDHLGFEKGVSRMVGEPDDRLRLRIQLRAMAQSAAGSSYHYRFHALSSDPRVVDVAVYSPDHPGGYNMGGRVYVAVLSTEGSGTPSVGLMDVVRERVTSKQVAMATDIVYVEPAVPRVVQVSATVTLLPGTPYAIFQNLSTAFRAKFAAVQGLGRDVTRSWVMSALHVPGVHSVALPTPAEDTRVAPNEFPIISGLTIVFGGFSDSEGNNSDAMEASRLARLVYEYYVTFAVANRRTATEIMADLAEKDAPGIIQPTVQGLCTYLGLTNTKDTGGNWLPEDELVVLAHLRLSKQYT